MTRFLDRQKAVELRQQGLTYSEIKETLSVSKGTLSGWLSSLELTERQIKVLNKKITSKKYLAVEKTRSIKLKKRTRRLQSIYEEEKEKLLKLSYKELYLAGLFLYWGEGVKSLTSAVGLNNTDPRVVKFYLYWLKDVLNVPKDKLRVYLHLYSDMQVDQKVSFWSSYLRLSKRQFIRPYIKTSSREGISHKGFGHGTCGIYINDVRLKEKIIKGIEAISDFYIGKLE